MKTPSLTDLRRWIKKHGWNGYNLASRKLTNGEFFAGECHNASCALSTMLAGTDPRYTDDKYVVRGWYCGEITAFDRDYRQANFHEWEEKHAHSWVVFHGWILDPTWHQFTNAKAKMYMFHIDDQRFQPDPTA